MLTYNEMCKYSRTEGKTRDDTQRNSQIAEKFYFASDAFDCKV